jgi:hypothetical protein
MVSSIEREANTYKAKLNSLLRDGKVTTAEVDSLITAAKGASFQEVDAHYLSGFVDHARDKFEPAARAKLEAFVATELARHAPIEGDTGQTPAAGAEPKFTSGDQKASAHVEWNTHPGQLVVGGMSADDPLQGQVGDCYFISSLSSVAASHPELLQKAITANANGTYTITFHQRDAGASTTHPVQVTVDGKLPTKSGQLEYAAARDPKELWPQLFEKAYAAWKGSYANIEGGMAATALEALTGARGAFYPVTAELKPDDVYATLRSSLANKGCVVALSKPWTPSRQGVVADHAYTVLGVKDEGGVKQVQVRNPWGQSEPGNDGKDDGSFWLPMSDFMGSFASIEAARP